MKCQNPIFLFFFFSLPGIACGISGCVYDCIKYDSVCVSVCVMGARRLRDGVTPHTSSVSPYSLPPAPLPSDMCKCPEPSEDLASSRSFFFYHPISSPNELQFDLFHTLGVQFRSCWEGRSSTAL